jgi:hypothetical protein
MGGVSTGEGVIPTSGPTQARVTYSEYSSGVWCPGASLCICRWHGDHLRWAYIQGEHVCSTAIPSRNGVDISSQPASSWACSCPCVLTEATGALNCTHLGQRFRDMEWGRWIKTRVWSWKVPGETGVPWHIVWPGEEQALNLWLSCKPEGYMKFWEHTCIIVLLELSECNFIFARCGAACL